MGLNGILITSTDGVTWTKQASDTTEKFTAVAYGGGYGGSLFVAGGINVIKTSPDGLTWTTRKLPTNMYSLGGVTAGPNGNFVAVGDNHSVLTSPDGITWTPHLITDGPALIYLNGVAYNPVLNKYVSTVSGSGYVVTSADGINWKAGPSGTITHLKAVRYLQGKFLAVGEQATIRSSSSGLTWKPVTIEPLIALYGAAYGNVMLP